MVVASTCHAVDRQRHDLRREWIHCHECPLASGTHNITVTLKDGRRFAGTVMGSDTAFDVAVIGIDGAINLPTVGTTTTSRAPSAAAPASEDRGAQVDRVVNSVPAADTGIKAGDVITSFAGAEIYNRDELLQRLVLQHPGDIVPVAVTRAGQALSLNLTLTEIRAP